MFSKKKKENKIESSSKKNYNTTNFEITVQASWDKVVYTLLKPRPPEHYLSSKVFKVYHRYLRKYYNATIFEFST